MFQTNFKIVLETPAKIPAVNVDRQRIKQILDYLVAFLRVQGASQIQIRMLAEPRAVSTQVTAPEVTLTTRQQAELFEATAAVDSSGRSKLTTGGLSLPLAAKLATKLDGQLHALSKSATGVTFVLTLPVFEAQ